MRTSALLILLLFGMSCQTQKRIEDQARQTANEKKKIRYNKEPEILMRGFTPDQSQTGFEIRRASLSDSKLTVSVKYGGGCKIHEFKMFLPKQTGSDTLNLYLLHLTTDDRCKAFVLNEMEFDLRRIKNELSSSKTLVINNKFVVKEGK